MQVAPSGGQICDQCKWRHLVAKFATNAGAAMLFNPSHGVNFWVHCASGNVFKLSPAVFSFDFYQFSTFSSVLPSLSNFFQLFVDKITHDPH